MNQTSVDDDEVEEISPKTKESSPCRPLSSSQFTFEVEKEILKFE